MKKAFTDFLQAHPAIKLIFVGVRRTDPHCQSLHEFDPTDNGWPSFMRCHPIVNWSYATVWTYLREANVPYCPLYDEGYTSLGPRSMTLPNPHLRNPDGSYRPAFMLTDELRERDGRLHCKPNAKPVEFD